MRIKITLSTDKSGIIDFNYQHQIQGLIYTFLASSDPDYSAWLHEHGFVYKRDKRFKLFVFSGITFNGPIKTIGSNRSNNSSGLNSLNGFCFSASSNRPFTLSFQIASPVHQFIQHLIDGIFKEGQEIKLGRQCLNVHRIETLPELLPLPLRERVGVRGDSNNYSVNLCPLESPIFVKKPMPEGERDKYLFPGDDAYEELLNQNLTHKYETLYGKSYNGDLLKFEFHPVQGKSIKIFKIYKNGKITGEIKGTLQPFTVKGTEELIKVGLDCGFGQNNSMGCGYVEVETTVFTVKQGVLLMAKAKNKALEIASEYIKKLREAGIRVNKAYLYGSYARETAKKDSDIDVAIISSDFTGDRFNDTLFLKKFRMNLDLRIEPLPMKPEDFIEENPIVSEILNHAIPISVHSD